MLITYHNSAISFYNTQGCWGIGQNGMGNGLYGMAIFLCSGDKMEWKPMVEIP